VNNEAVIKGKDNVTLPFVIYIMNYYQCLRLSQFLPLLLANLQRKAWLIYSWGNAPKDLTQSLSN
jgi:hypothetical protein